MRLLVHAVALAAASMMLSGGSAARAQVVGLAHDSGFQAFLAGLRSRAEAAGVRRATLDAVFPTLSFNPRVIELDRAQPGGNPNAPAAAIPRFAPYAARHVDGERIGRG